jgi:phosphodiesterase/alkaline phosphatase D-like protein
MNLDPEIKSLILDYITAYNNDDHELANQYLSKIQEHNMEKKLNGSDDRTGP